MKIVRGSRQHLCKASMPLLESGYVVSMGNFDGVHLGHKAILQRVKNIAYKLNLPSLVVIFEPQPEEYFKGINCPARLTRLREKLEFLRTFEIDYIFVMPFTEIIAKLSAENFVKNFLADCLYTKHLVIGDDFCFGVNRLGDFKFLKKISAKYGFEVEASKTITLVENTQKIRVSSTWIREALHLGDLQLAAKLLGRSYSMCGKVVHGDKRGRTLNFPTANIFLHRKKTPISGVYVVRVFGADDKSVVGVANIGSRPTIGGAKPILEVHLFDFDQDIYGRYVRVEFLAKLRDEKFFPSFEKLKEQIAQDIEQALDFFAEFST